MGAVVEEVCTITAKGQTTVPKSVRQALGVGYGGRIAFRVEAGTVTIHAVSAEEPDPALAPFLALLEGDLSARPDAVRALTKAHSSRLEKLARDVGEVDPETPIEGDVSL